MKILSPEQIQSADEFTIKHLPISSFNLMEQAATICSDFISTKYPKLDKIIIVCGKGNNGGDGLAIARILSYNNYYIEVFVIDYTENTSIDFKENLNLYKGKINYIHSVNDFKVVSTSNTLIIDAILGNGLNRPIEGLIKEIISQLNLLNGIKLAIDIPTGLFANSKNLATQETFKANITLTFQAPKLNFLMKENYPIVGDFEILDIGWPPEADNNLETDYYFTTKRDILSLYKKREKFVSKFDFGHAFIIAGSYGKVGAALIATKACLRSGAGLTTTYSPECAYTILQSQAPEAMCISDSNLKYISEQPPINNYNAVAIGSGIGLNTKTKEVALDILQQTNCPIVIDADAINILAENKTNLQLLKPNSILTPHNKEFERLTKQTDNDYDKLQLAIEFVKTYKVILVLKGVYTAVINSDGKVHFNSTGNSALSKGGSGDMLTGIIVANLAKGYKPISAAILSVYLHGLTAELCLKKQNIESVTTSDLIEELKNVL
jgi:hydroxyethylthiazole kinase-like uncharacterized protein yjeF